MMLTNCYHEYAIITVQCVTICYVDKLSWQIVALINIFAVVVKITKNMLSKCLDVELVLQCTSLTIKEIKFTIDYSYYIINKSH